MDNELEVLCEVMFSDPKSGIETNLVGTIDKLKLIKFFKGSDEFLVFKERTHPPIPKSDVKEIVIYREDVISDKKESSSSTKYLKPNYGKIV